MGEINEAGPPAQLTNKQIKELFIAVVKNVRLAKRQQATGYPAPKQSSN